MRPPTRNRQLEAAIRIMSILLGNLVDQKQIFGHNQFSKRITFVGRIYRLNVDFSEGRGAIESSVDQSQKKIDPGVVLHFLLMECLSHSKRHGRNCLVRLRNGVPRSLEQGPMRTDQLEGD